MPSEARDEITYLFPNFNVATIEVWEWMKLLFHPILNNGCDYLSMLGLKLFPVSKWAPGSSDTIKCSTGADVLLFGLTK